MKRSALILLILLCAPWLVVAQSVWQGSCAVGTYSSFPSTGLYGASNSFPQNTLVTVENSKTNRKATVLIIDRLDNSDLFMLLSRDAGSAIGLSPGEVGQVTVTLARKGGAIARGPADLPYSTDPDIFPPAGVGNANSLSFLDKYLKSSGAAAPSVATEQPSVSPLSPQPSQKAPAGPPSAKPPAPQLAQATTAPPQGAPTPPQPTTAPPSQQAQPVEPAGSATQQVPSGSGVSGGVEPAGSTSLPSTPPAAPTPPAAESGGPVVTQLKPGQTPQAPAPVLAQMATPVVPERAGGAPTVSDLHQVTTPQQAQQLAFAEAPALPEIRNPGPALSGVAQAAPPSLQQPSLAMAVPTAPSQPTTGPTTSELAPASPAVAPFVASVTAVPSIPAPAAAVAAAKPAGPMVSALAAARTPSSRFEVAQSQLPEPSTAGFTPEVSTLAQGQPPTTQPLAQAKSVPAPEIAQRQTAPAVSGAKPAPPSQPAPARQPAQPPRTIQPSQPPAVAEAAPGQPLSTAAGTIRMVGRIPVRPSTALAPASYYLQLGVYVDSKAAVALADNLSPDYPVSVYAFEQAKRPLYKVMIGPLNSDESGTLLYLFIAQGYKDAFVRKGE